MKKIIDQGKYIPRLIDDSVERFLTAIGAVCIEGPKWCGKTWTSYPKFLAKMLSDAIQGTPFFSYDEAQSTSAAQIVETAVDSAKYGGKRTIGMKPGWRVE